MFAACLYVFCVEIIGNGDHDLYPHEFQLQSLEFQTNLTLHNATYLLDAIEFNVKIEIQKALYNTVVTKTHLTFHKLADIATTAEEKGLDISECYDQQKVAAHLVAQHQILGMEVCLIDIHTNYTELSEAAEDLVQSAQGLLASAKEKADNCQDGPADEIESCLEYEITQLQKKGRSLQYVLDKLYVNYQEALVLVSQAVECIETNEKPIVTRLYKMLDGIRVCYEKALKASV